MAISGQKEQYIQIQLKLEQNISRCIEKQYKKYTQYFLYTQVPTVILNIIKSNHYTTVHGNMKCLTKF